MLFLLIQKSRKKDASWAPNQHIKINSKGSRDTEDWSNDCWKFSFAIHHRNKYNFKIEINSYKL